MKELEGVVPDSVQKEVIAELKPICEKAYNDHQVQLKKEADEKEAKEKKRKEEAQKAAAALEVAKKQQARATQMANEARATQMAKERAERKIERARIADELVEDAKDEEYEKGRTKGQKNLHELLKYEDSDEEEEEDDAEPAEAEEKKGPFKLDMATFVRTAGNGTLFRKHKYRRRWDDDARYQPKEVFIKVNFDAENGDPLRITWGTGNRHVEWETVKLIAWGLHTPTYTAMQQRMDINPLTCFSVVSTHTILDVQNETRGQSRPGSRV
eukprot:TRINITY_DN1113_c0_g1_i4.p1 TRINITY_DN1113_c0_g1~~TRINITY_DN1113_c0_g1_i4.p1  ORF type:complete len:270 (+),score=72.31 TRINITY_DN1113_c0_g1_i4:250-1059(+)